MDLADEAQRWEEAERQMALARQRRNAQRGCGLGTASAFECVECSDQIPEERRQILKGVRLCTRCASEVERYGRLRGT